MRPLLVLALVASPLLGRAGPDTAMNAAVLDSGWQAAVRVEQRACPPPVICEFALELPSPGYDLSKPEVTVDRDARRIRIEMRALPKPGDGAWPAVMTPTKASVALGVLTKGRWVVEAHYAVGENRPLLPVHAFVLDAS